MTDIRHAESLVSLECRSAPGEGPDPRRWKALILLCVANFMIILDAQIVILALPSIERHLRMTVGAGQWVLSAYLLAFGGLLLLGGRLADLRGRRRMFMIGTTLFLMSSLLCGLAWTGEVLIVARVLQGVSAAMMAPAALATLMTMFPHGAERTKALACWSGVGGLGATAALLIGGTLTGTLGWGWIFLLNVPVAAGLLAFAPKLLAETRDSHRAHSYDVGGALTITLGLLSFIGAIVEAPTHGWVSWTVLGLLAAASILIGAFVTIERRSAAPLVPLAMFRSRLFVGGCLTIALITMIAWGTGFTVSEYAQSVLGYSPLRFGLATTALTVMTIVGAYTAQAAVTKFGTRVVAAASMVLMGSGAFLFSQVSVHGSYVKDLFPGLLILGLGIGGGPVAAITAAMSSIKEHEAGVASGINTAFFQIGAALGTAIVAGVIISEAGQSTRPTVLTGGIQAGFTACVALAIVGFVVVVILLRREVSRNDSLGGESTEQSASLRSKIPDPPYTTSTVRN
jgi:EmrB/QacA subfamily drug resistance transporter